MVLSKPLNRYIDHTLLKPLAMDVAFEGLLEEAVNNNFYSVCVSPYIALPVVKALATYPNTRVCTVVAFPHGNIPLELKVREVDYFINGGVDEIDWVLHYGDVLNENWKNVIQEMSTIAKICRKANVVSKCIVESSELNNHTLLSNLFEIVRDSGVDFIKTSTGFGSGGGAKLSHIQLWNSMRNGAPTPYIKASGGIKSAEQALAMIEAGADRLGTSASVEIMEQYNALKSNSTEGEGTPKEIPA